eukprot:CAMPEP_0169114472 /NCGR_PEP_ID=MMETSP1015-20121227/28775_1 /TAXON_ID=342587 /ORGANISM="Karlodinium micrum, Strain CCMP2283" /LENGTH=120 /DNA_ID=CAMNT_0009176755 /DNA_START=83 /DNA_END=441 /DNA_ORIENTATION=+
MRSVTLLSIALACTDMGQGAQLTHDQSDDISAKALAMALLANSPTNVAARRHVTQGMAAGLAAATALGGGIQGAKAGPFTRTELNSLTYQQIKGTGLANTCPKVESPGGSIAVGGLKRMS